MPIRCLLDSAATRNRPPLLGFCMSSTGEPRLARPRYIQKNAEMAAYGAPSGDWAIHHAIKISPFLSALPAFGQHPPHTPQRHALAAAATGAWRAGRCQMRLVNSTLPAQQHLYSLQTVVLHRQFFCCKSFYRFFMRIDIGKEILIDVAAIIF